MIILAAPCFKGTSKLVLTMSSFETLSIHYNYYYRCDHSATIAQPFYKVDLILILPNQLDISIPTL